MIPYQEIEPGQYQKDREKSKKYRGLKKEIQ
jgi:hypothetical protein